MSVCAAGSVRGAQGRALLSPVGYLPSRPSVHRTGLSRTHEQCIGAAVPVGLFRVAPTSACARYACVCSRYTHVRSHCVLAPIVLYVRAPGSMSVLCDRTCSPKWTCADIRRPVSQHPMTTLVSLSEEISFFGYHSGDWRMTRLELTLGLKGADGRAHKNKQPHTWEFMSKGQSGSAVCCK